MFFLELGYNARGCRNYKSLFPCYDPLQSSQASGNPRGKIQNFLFAYTTMRCGKTDKIVNHLLLFFFHVNRSAILLILKQEYRYASKV